jgi:uronate dehydrogenase
MQRLLITGAAGVLGTYLRKELSGLLPLTRLTDIKDISDADGTEEIIKADLGDFDAVAGITQDVSVILHMGGAPSKGAWEDILRTNIIGCYNLWKAARLNNVKRIVFASSIHATGMYPRTQILDADSLLRPDSMYGVSKAFGENLARMYFDKHGIEAACLRIGSCAPEVTFERMLSTWLSYRDLAQLCRRCIQAPRLGYVTVYGVSNNDRLWWDNSKVDFLSYCPQDNAEDYAQRLQAAGSKLDPSDPAMVFQGGSFARRNFSGKLPEE